MTRRPLGLKILFAAAFAASAWSGEACAQATPNKVTLVVPSAVVLPYHGFLFLGVPLGFYKHVGLPNVDIESIDGSAAALQLLAKGDADMGHMGLSAFVAAKLNQPSLPVRAVFLQDIKSIYAIGIPINGTIKDVAGLKGKRIGVLDMASGAVPWLKEYLQEHGLSEKDVDVVAIGAGAPAAAALKANRVDAICLSTGLSASVESLGFPMRYFTKDEPSGIIVANEKFMSRHPDAVTRVLQGIILNQTFMEVNPDAAVREYWKMYGKPHGQTNETAMQQGRLYVVRLSEIWKDYRDENLRWGAMRDTTWTDLAQFKPIKEKLTGDKLTGFVHSLYTDQFIQTANAVDLSPALTAARADQ